MYFYHQTIGHSERTFRRQQRWLSSTSSRDVRRQRTVADIGLRSKHNRSLDKLRNKLETLLCFVSCWRCTVWSQLWLFLRFITPKHRSCSVIFLLPQSIGEVSYNPTGRKTSSSSSGVMELHFCTWTLLCDKYKQQQQQKCCMYKTLCLKWSSVSVFVSTLVHYLSQARSKTPRHRIPVSVVTNDRWPFLHV